MSKASPHRCKSCARESLKEWIAANPSEYERTRRKSHLKLKYGISPEQYDSILLSQGGVCAICGNEPTDSRGSRPHVDHCHDTGKMRGILCGSCNKGIGSLKDDPEIIRRALEYLLKHQEEVIS